MDKTELLAKLHEILDLRPNVRHENEAVITTRQILDALKLAPNLTNARLVTDTLTGLGFANVQNYRGTWGFSGIAWLPAVQWLDGAWEQTPAMTEQTTSAINYRLQTARCLLTSEKTNTRRVRALLYDGLLTNDELLALTEQFYRRVVALYAQDTDETEPGCCQRAQRVAEARAWLTLTPEQHQARWNNREPGERPPRLTHRAARMAAWAADTVGRQPAMDAEEADQVAAIMALLANPASQGPRYLLRFPWQK